MKIKAFFITIITLFVLVFLLGTALTIFSGKTDTPETAEPVLTAAPVSTSMPTEPPVTAAEPGRQNGERFEDVIILEGMEETVRYEHIINDTLGIEMDYDYDRFVRRSEPNRECFISVYDNQQNPENYLEVTYRAENADAVAASISQVLSQEYDLSTGPRELERAGSCTWIEASVIKGTNNMADQLQIVYIIPAADGCRVATEHLAIEASEGFGRRFSYMLHTLAVNDSKAEQLSDEQALSAIKIYCTISNPDLADIVSAGEYPVYWEISSSNENEIVVLFRSYTGAQNRYYIDRNTGNTYVTEFVPGITSAEERTGESFNVKDYMLSIPGTWQTASVGYADNGTMSPEYTVQFTGAYIIYGHLKNGEFVPDHSDKITSFEEPAAGRYKVQASSSNGVQYTYRTSESDSTVLEYYETWNEADFSAMYRGGASLSRSN